MIRTNVPNKHEVIDGHTVIKKKPPVKAFSFCVLSMLEDQKLCPFRTLARIIIIKMPPAN